MYRNLTLLQVQKFAQTLARQVAKHGAVIGLTGNLGAGKTTFAKAFARALGIKTVKSPTFIVSQRYTLRDTYLYHLDFYRLDHPKQLEPLGLSEIMSGRDIVLIEWVDKFMTIMKKCDILINLKVKQGNKRDVQIRFKK